MYYLLQWSWNISKIFWSVKQPDSEGIPSIVCNDSVELPLNEIINTQNYEKIIVLFDACNSNSSQVQNKKFVGFKNTIIFCSSKINQVSCGNQNGSYFSNVFFEKLEIQLLKKKFNYDIFVKDIMMETLKRYTKMYSKLDPKIFFTKDITNMETLRKVTDQNRDESLISKLLLTAKKKL